MKKRKHWTSQDFLEPVEQGRCSGDKTGSNSNKSTFPLVWMEPSNSVFS